MCKPCTPDRAVERIVAYASAAGLTKSRLAREAGLKDTTLRHFGTESWNPTLKILRRLAVIVPDDFRDGEAA